MAKAFCRRCKGSAEGSTFEEASSKINHAVSLARSIPCGASYGCVVDVSPKTSPPKQAKKTTKSKDKTPKETPEKKKEVKTETAEKKEESQAVSE